MIDPFGVRIALSYQQQRKILCDDLLAKFYREDMHGVSDAANDIRVLEAYYFNNRRQEVNE